MTAVGRTTRTRQLQSTSSAFLEYIVIMLTLAILCSKDITQTYGAKLEGEIKEKQNPER
jgi:hypothetical protein